MRIPAFRLSGTVGAFAIWAAATAATLAFVGRYGFKVPIWDEWHWFRVAAGDAPVTLQWLWSQHNEHRMFLPRLVYVALIRATGFDFQALALFNVFALSALAIALMLTVPARRGRTELADAFFPLILLHWSQAENLIWGFQLNFIISVVLAGTLLAVILRCGDSLHLHTALFFSLCTVALGLCGMYGLVYLPAAACWILFAAVRQWWCHPAGSRWKGLGIAALALAPLALVICTFVGLRRPASPPNPGVLASVSTSLEFLSGGMGRAAKEFWPLSGLVALAACAAIAWQCWRALRDRPAERLRAAGLVCFLAGTVLLALGIGWGRSCGGPGNGYQLRYATLAAPLFCLVFAVCSLYTGEPLRRRLERIFLVAACVLWAVNAYKGLQYASHMNEGLNKLSRDLRDGVPTDALALRYAEQWAYMQPESFRPVVQSFRKACVRPCRGGVYHPEEPSIRVRRLVPIASGSPIELAPLGAGADFVQKFTMEGNATLSRVDLELVRRQRNACLGRLVWRLLGDLGDQPLAEGIVDLRDVEAEPYVSIDLPAVEVRGTTQFSLVLRFAGEVPDNTFIEVPRYPRKPEPPQGTSPSGDELNCVAAARGFLYLRDAEPLTASRDAGKGSVRN